jgi:hypothetical protein
MTTDDAYHRFVAQHGFAYDDVRACVDWLSEESDRPPPAAWNTMTVFQREHLFIMIGEELVRKLAALRMWPA